MYLEKQVQIKVEGQHKAQVRAILFDETPTKVPAEYSDYSNIFSAENAAELSKNTGINKNTIKLEENKQSSSRFIYNLGPIELETLKTYIKYNLANGFIRPSKLLAGVFILFNWEPDRSF